MMTRTPRFWALHAGIPIFIAVFMCLIYPKTGLDARLIAPYFDVIQQRFPLKHHIILEDYLHDGLRNCMILVAILALLASLGANKIAPLRAYKKQLLWTFVGMVISTSVVSMLKHFSIHGCPNDLMIYGGELPYLQLFESLPAGAPAGRCFPGGHASGGFALMAFYFAFRESQPKFAKLMLGFAMLLGMLMGWGQMMRGEHFLSHHIWCAWVVWMVLLVLSLAWPPDAQARH